MKSKKRGVTLIELAVVVGIVGVLATITYSKITRSISKAKDAKALTSLDALRKASFLYYSDKEKSFSRLHERGDCSEDNPCTILTEDIERLVNLGYLESKALKVFSGNNNGYKDEYGIGKDIGSLQVGSIGTEESCKMISTPGHVKLEMGKDGLEIIVNSEKYDSSCSEWAKK